MYKKKELESIFIEVINPQGKNIIVGCVYRHPCMDLSLFNDTYLRDLLDKLICENKTIIIMGDFNADILKYDSDRAIAEFVDLMYSNFLLPYICAPTRITSHSRTLIDNIFSNNIEEGNISGNIITTISDHYAQILLMKNLTTIKSPSSDIFQHNFKNFNKNLFESDLKNINWDLILKTNNNNVDNSFEEFFTTFNAILDRHAPIKKLSKKEIKLQQKPWITKGILTSIMKKNRIYKKLSRTKNIEKKNTLKIQFKHYRNSILKITNSSKAMHFNHFFDTNKQNYHKIWQGIKEIINISKNKKQFINSINNKIETTHDPFKIANTFNEFFSNIAKKIEGNITTTFKTHTDYLTDASPNSFFIYPTTSKEVESIINTLKNNKTTGPYSIPTKILKTYKTILSQPISELVNLSFTNGVFPKILKTASVTPIHKKGDKLECNNYRPISILSNISKLIEKLMHLRLYLFLEQNQVLYKLQFGFRNKHSTNLALIEITEKIRKACDEGLYACGIYLDFQKAFDTVNHSILLSKLEHYGIRGTTNNWFRSFICDRLQFTTINGQNSNQNKITHGVPQGSVLGPLLFIIFINDLHKAVQHSNVHHFADDTNLLLINKSLKKIKKLVNHDLKLITHWLRANKISLNANKTEIVIFR